MIDLKKLAEEIIPRVSKKSFDLQNKAVDEHGLLGAPLIDSTEFIVEEIVALCERVQKESLATSRSYCEKSLEVNVDLKALAEEITSYYDLQLIDDSKIIEILERVQKENLAARIEWPNSDTFRKELVEHADKYQRDFLDPVLVVASSVAIRMEKWLRDNIRLAPLEPVSDEELKKIARDNCVEADRLRSFWIHAWICGFRAAEKRLKGE